MCSINSVIRCLCIYCIFCSVLVLVLVLAVLVAMVRNFYRLYLYHSTILCTPSSLPRYHCRRASIASSGTASTPGRRSTGIPSSFPFFLLLFFFFTLLLFHNHCMMVGSNVSITVEPTIAKQGGFPLSQFIPRLKLFVEIP